MTRRMPLLTLLLCLCRPVGADTIAVRPLSLSLLEPSVMTGTVLNTRLSNGLFVGAQNDTTYANFNLGFDLPVLSLNTARGLRYDLGLFAFTHVYTLPRNSKFYVDNFYAGFGISVGGYATDWLSWRLFPVYHLSAHLADGHRGDTLANAHAVSNECVRAEACLRPFTGAEAGVALCGYYHTVYRKQLTAAAEVDLAYYLEITRVLAVMVQGLNEFTFEDGVAYGADVSGGLLLGTRTSRSARILIRYYNRLHPGYYAGERVSGWGMRMRFCIR